MLSPAAGVARPSWEPLVPISRLGTLVGTEVVGYLGLLLGWGCLEGDCLRPGWALVCKALGAGKSPENLKQILEDLK